MAKGVTQSPVKYNDWTQRRKEKIQQLSTKPIWKCWNVK